MCCRRRRNCQRPQPVLIVAGAAMYSAYENRKMSKAQESTAQHLSSNEMTMPANNPKSNTMLPKTNQTEDPLSNLALQEKGIPPPDYNEAVAAHRITTSNGASAVDSKSVPRNESDRESFVDDEKNPEEAKEEVKMGFFERLRAKKEAKRAAWMAARGGGMGRGRGRGCCGRRRGGFGAC